MKRLALLAFAPLLLVRSAAADGKPAAPEAVIQKVLIQPLAAKERDQSKFSRARMPAQERRVRVLDAQPQIDAKGNAFYTFAVDARHGIRNRNDDAGWRLATHTGCAYVEGGEVFVKVGDGHRPAAFLVGKKLKAAAETTCRAATTDVAQLAGRE